MSARNRQKAAPTQDDAVNTALAMAKAIQSVTDRTGDAADLKKYIRDHPYDNRSEPTFWVNIVQYMGGTSEMDVTTVVAALKATFREQQLFDVWQEHFANNTDNTAAATAEDVRDTLRCMGITIPDNEKQQTLRAKLIENPRRIDDKSDIGRWLRQTSTIVRTLQLLDWYQKHGEFMDSPLRFRCNEFVQPAESLTTSTIMISCLEARLLNAINAENSGNITNLADLERAVRRACEKYMAVQSQVEDAHQQAMIKIKAVQQQVCFRCGSSNHRISDCPTRDQQQGQRAPVECRSFGTSEGCRFGDKCRFKHSEQSGNRRQGADRHQQHPDRQPHQQSRRQAQRDRSPHREKSPPRDRQRDRQRERNGNQHQGRRKERQTQRRP
jgi:hypothetical protein